MDTQKLLSSVEDALVTEIADAVGKMFFMEPLYAILIDYFHWTYLPTPTCDLDTRPPLVVAAPISVRREIIDGHDYADAVQWDAYYVAEVDGSVKLQLSTDGEASVLCRDVYGSFDEGDESLGTMLQRVAARLNACNWRSITNVTDDFVVCLQDGHGEHDNEKDIDACIPPDKVSLLRSRKLLWSW